MSHLDTLKSLIAPHLSPEARSWLEEGIATITAAEEPEPELARRFAAARRRLGSTPLEPVDIVLDTPCGPLALTRWSTDLAGRACLLLAGTTGTADAERLVAELYRHGDEAERGALVRALCLLPSPCGHAPVAQAAGRANSLRLVSALAIDNPWPAACLSRDAFHGLVLKCLFLGLPLARVQGLADLSDAALSRRCRDYAEERLAAGRAAPADLWLALVPGADDDALALAIAALDDPDVETRLIVANALAERREVAVVAEALARIGAVSQPLTG